MVFSFFMLNAIFVLVVYILQAKKEFVSIQWFIAKSYNVSYENDEVIGPLVTVSGEYLNFEPIGKSNLRGPFAYSKQRWIWKMWKHNYTWLYLWNRTNINKLYTFKRVCIHHIFYNCTWNSNHWDVSPQVRIQRKLTTVITNYLKLALIWL